jgi:signal transduction histidine kinase
MPTTSNSSLNDPQNLTANNSEASQRASRLASLVNIGKILSANRRLDTILKEVRLQIQSVLDTKNFYIATCEISSNELVMIYNIENNKKSSNLRCEMSEGLSGHIVSTKKPLIFRNSKELENFIAREKVHPLGEMPISWMGVPLMAGEQVIGVMGIQSYENEVGYNRDDLDYFITVGTLLGIAIQNNRYMESTIDKMTRFSILLEISQAIALDLEIDSLMTTVYCEVSRIFDTKNFYIATHEKGSTTWDWAFHVEGGERQKSTRHGLDEGLTGFVIRTKQSLHFSTTRELLSFTESQNVVVLDQPPVSWMLVPLIARDHTAGVMAIQNYEQEYVYNKEDLELFSTIASVVASALYIAQLFQEVGRQNQELEETNLELKETQIKLIQAQKLESIGQLAAGIAHEINTPIQYIGDNTRFFQSSIEDLIGAFKKYEHTLSTVIEGVKEVNSTVAEIQEEFDLNYLLTELPVSAEATLDGVNRVSSIVKALKDFSYPDSRQKTPLDINEAITNTTIVCRNEWKYVADLTFDLNDKLPHVLCFPGDINQVFMNLIINGAHAIHEKQGDSNEKGLITISTFFENDYVVIKIKDSGTGISEDMIDKIFDPFFTTKQVGKGTGQGLAISRNIIVTKHGGTIDVESSLGEGTTFIICLPVGA